jgi:hypothetical protein
MDFEQHLNKFWRAGSATMVNHQSGKSTDLNWNNYAFKNDVFLMKGNIKGN